MSKTRHLVDPELLPLLDAWPPITLDETTLPLMRDPGRLPTGAMPDLTSVEKKTALAPGRDGAPDVPLTLYRPAGSSGEVLGCIYHMHGGGFVCGSAASMEPIHRRMVETLGCALVSVDYRLAPETCFPGPLDDCYTGLAWLFSQADALAIDAGRIGVMGESAGGGLAAALALLARDRGEYRLAFQHLIYPVLDDRTCTRRPGSSCWRVHLGPRQQCLRLEGVPGRATRLRRYLALRSPRARR
jgi:acetyl esterase/lipase